MIKGNRGILFLSTFKSRRRRRGRYGAVAVVSVSLLH
jgi:hypothetical protein